MRLLCLFLLTFWQLPAFAEIIFTSNPEGASEFHNFNANNPKLITFDVAGGITSAACISGGGSTTCNSCATGWVNGNTACNEKQISPSTELVLRFQSTSIFGAPIITTTSTTLEQPVTTTIPVNPTLGPNQTVELRLTWGTICAAFNGGNSSCTGSGGVYVKDQLFKVGFDGGTADQKLDSTSSDDWVQFKIHVVNLTGDASVESAVYGPADHTACAHGGICNFTLLPGDEKAYIRDLQIMTMGDSRQFKSVIFSCVNGDSVTFANIDKACTGRVAISGSNALANDTIDGMPNGIETFFRAVAVDIAGNYGPFLNIDQASTPGVPGQSVTPDAVMGLLDDNCFIATAAYGSPMEKHVKILRTFRDRVLLQSTAGKFFVKAYYKLSPPLAQWIAQTSERRSVTRILLAPAVFMASALMTYPLHFGLLWIISVMGFCFWVRHRKEQQV